MNIISIQQLEDEVTSLKRDVASLTKQVRELQEENAYLKTLMETVSKSTTTLIVAVKGDTDYKRKGLIDDIRDLSDMVKDMKTELNGFTTLKTKALGVVAFFSVFGTGGLFWLCKTIYEALQHANK